MAINLFTVNICRINHKINTIKHFLETDNVSILAISETKTSKPIKINKFHIYQHVLQIANAEAPPY
jgi:hypothetical protein